jgi:hypothetical protein
MALDGGVGIGNGISKRPSQNCSVAVEKAAHRADEETEEEDERKPWVARKWITSLAVCLAALPLLVIMVSRRDGPFLLPSGWTPATTARTYDRRGRNHPIYTSTFFSSSASRHGVFSSISHAPCFRNVSWR